MIALLYAGLGQTWPNMAQGLLAWPRFSHHLEHACRAWASHSGMDLWPLFRSNAPQLGEAQIGHPALVALQLALTASLKDIGLPIHHVLGHSLGEVAAGFAAKRLTMDQAMAIVAVQKKLIDRVRGKGGMAYIGCSESELKNLLEPLALAMPQASQALALAAVNGNDALVLSGGHEALEALGTRAEAQGLFMRRLALDFCAHHPSLLVQSKHVALDAVPTLQGPAANTSAHWIGCLDGQPIKLLPSWHWLDQMTQTVRFDRALDALVASGVDAVLELGAHPVHARDVAQAFARKGEKQGHGSPEHLYLSTLDKRGSSSGAFGHFLAALQAAGVPIQLDEIEALDAPLGERLQRYQEVLAASEKKRQGHAQNGRSEDVPQANDATMALLVRYFNAAMGMDAQHRPDPQAGFMAQGLSSVLGARFTASLSKALGRKIPVTALFDYPNLEALHEHLHDTKLGDAIDPMPGKSGTKIPKQGKTRERNAVVGMACRFPGGANNPDAFWQLLVEGRDGTSSIPADRWENSRFYDADPTAPGKSVITRGGFLQTASPKAKGSEADPTASPTDAEALSPYDPYAFDAAAFRISPAEATAMDPQHRLLLECVLEAFHDAGLPIESWRGKRVGVFLGICSDDYKASHFYSGDLERIDQHALIGSVFSAASGRVSFTFGFQGPAISVDTACSSSLVALHLANRALREGDCDLAIAGGINLLLAPNGFVYFSKLRAGSPDGTCRPFDAGAKGYARGEGCGLLLLQPESEAREAGHRIQGFIAGTATNQDGESSGFTVPNGLAQQRLYRAALHDAGWTPDALDYLEAHGTGTPLGDPIEVGSAMAVYADGHNAEHPLRIGSVKSNIGHLEGAAGISGVIKTLLAMRHGRIPATLHLERPNPEIDWSAPFHVPTQTENWPEGIADPAVPRPRRAAVSAFGFSGSNAHVLLEADASMDASKDTSKPGHPEDQAQRHTAFPELLYLLSADHADALPEEALRHARFLEQGVKNKHPQAWIDLAYTAAIGRSHKVHRLVLRATSAAEAAEALRAFAGGENHPAILADGSKAALKNPKLALAFSGQGAQYPGMAMQLYATHPVFRESMDRCAAVLGQLEGSWDAPGAGAQDRAIGASAWQLIELLHHDADSKVPSHPIHTTALAQPALLAVELSLLALWRHWGLKADAVLGHSLGEFSAAVAAGILEEEDALKLVAERARLMQSVPDTPLGKGAMAAVSMDADQLQGYLHQNQGPQAFLEWAAENGPQQQSIAGPSSSIEAFCAAGKALGYRAKRLDTSHAFHSAQMDPILDAFAAFAEGMPHDEPRLPLFRNLDGQPVPKGLSAQEWGSYWKSHLRSCVRFAAGLENAAREGHTLFLELGPNAVLLPLMHRVFHSPSIIENPLAQEPPRLVGSLRKGKDDLATLNESLALLHAAGAAIDWQSVFGDAAPDGDRLLRATLPGPHFKRERLFLNPLEALEGHRQKHGPVLGTSGQNLPLLGRRVDTPLDGRLYVQNWSATQTDWLGDHIMHGLQVFAGTGYLEMGMAAAKALYPRAQSLAVRNVQLQQAMVFAEGESREVQSLMLPEDDPGQGSNSSASGYRMRIHSRPAQGRSKSWKRHAEMHLEGSDKPLRLQRFRFDPVQRAAAQAFDVDGEGFYAITEQLGYGYQNRFQSVQRMAWTTESAYAEIDAGSIGPDQRGYRFHPGVLDACMQVFIATNVGHQHPDAVHEMIVPIRFAALLLAQPLEGKLYVDFRITENGQRIRVGDLCIQDESGTVIGRIEGLTGQLVSRRQLQRQARRDLSGLMWATQWELQKAPKPKAGMVGTGRQAPAVVLHQGHAFAAELAAKLGTTREVYTLQAVAGLEEYSTTERHFQLDPTRADQFRAVLQHIASASGEAPDQIFQAWGLDSPGTNDLEYHNALVLGGTLHLVQAMADAGWLGNLVLLSQNAMDPGPGNGGPAFENHNLDPAQHPLHGLGHALELERPNQAVLRIDLGQANAAELNQLLLELRQDDPGYGIGERIAYRGKDRYVARFLPWTARIPADEGLHIPAGDNAALRIHEQGLLENLRWESTDRPPLQSHEVRIKVQAMGLNFRDVLQALGQYPGAADALGLECTGSIVETGAGVTDLQVGDRIMAQVSSNDPNSGAFQREVVLDHHSAIPFPDHWSFEDAATVPGPYLTAWYALVVQASLKAGERILIHSAASGVGLAALHLARHLGAEVYASTSPAKYSDLERLGITRIYNSRSQAFGQAVQKDLDAEGVKGMDVVLNALSGTAIEAGLGLLQAGGRFVEMGKRGIWTAEQVHALNPELAYRPFDLHADAQQDSQLIPGLFRAVVPLLASGELPLLPKTVFDARHAESAFRFMAQGRHRGKIVLSLSHLNRKEHFEEASMVEAGACYLLSGGLGALGGLVSDWLIAKGATHLALLNRSQPNERQQALLARWNAQGVDARAYAVDIADRSDFRNVWSSIQKEMPTIRGIVHCAGVLDDAMATSMDWASMDKVLRPKVQGSWYLHEVTRGLPLDFFVCFSSIAAVFGNRGQSNYAAANYFLDALVAHRRKQGLPASCVNWGPWGEAGMATDTKKAAIMADQGFINLRTDAGLDGLERLIEEDLGHMVFADLDMQRFLPTMPASMRARFFSHIDGPIAEDHAAASEAHSEQGVWQDLAAAGSAGEQDCLESMLCRSVAAVLKIRDAEHIQRQKAFRELGFDSLTNAEFVNRVDKALQLGLPQSIYMDAPTVSEMARYILSMPAAQDRIEQERGKLPEGEEQKEAKGSAGSRPIGTKTSNAQAAPAPKTKASAKGTQQNPVPKGGGAQDEQKPDAENAAVPETSASPLDKTVEESATAAPNAQAAQGSGTGTSTASSGSPTTPPSERTDQEPDAVVAETDRLLEAERSGPKKGIDGAAPNKAKKRSLWERFLDSLQDIDQ